jgi:hypothetical protein
MIKLMFGIIGAVICSSAIPAAEIPAGDRLAKIVEANVVATHAWEILLADTVEKTPALLEDYQKGPFPHFVMGAFTRPQLHTLVDHQAALVKTDISQIKAWTEGKPSSFAPQKDLEPILAAKLTLSDSLPVNVMTAYLTAKIKKPAADIRAVANLMQMTLEEDRDADLTQDLLSFYCGLGLLVYFKQLGLPYTESDFLGMGKKLAPRTARAPYGATAEKWQIHGVAISSWAEKQLHIRDDQVLAKELLQEPDIKALLPKIKALPAQKIAVIGHSYTMHVHWASPSSFTQVTAAIFQQENSQVAIRHWTHGGLDAVRAQKLFYDSCLAWKPNTVILAVGGRKPADVTALAGMIKGFKAAGAVVYTFDRLGTKGESNDTTVAKNRAAVEAAGATVIEMGKVISLAPGADKFYAIDGRHMREPYHRLLAKELVKFLAGARKAALASVQN